MNALIYPANHQQDIDKSPSINFEFIKQQENGQKNPKAFNTQKIWKMSAWGVQSR